MAKKLNVPPYVIFQPATLEAMATTYPITLEELQNMPGVGPGKAKRYGKEFIELIKKHVEENEIERPKTCALKRLPISRNSKYPLFKLSIEKWRWTIWQNQGMDFEDMLSEVEAIIYAGTKINIDYF